MLYDKIQLEPNEKVLTTVRKHWFIIIMEMLGILLFALIPLFLFVVIALTPLPFDMANTFLIYSAEIVFITAGWLLLSTMAGAAIWTHYFLDLWVITDRRIIVIDQVHFFNRKVSNFRLERLQDIKVTIRGIIPTLLNYGTVRAQTASAAESNFTSTGLPAPRELQSLIQTAMDARLATLGNNINLAD
ncbi:MAG: PH domain-containing protein [Candidatus Paceibacteria bacterium]